MARLRARGRADAAHALAASTSLDSLAATATALVDAVPDEFIAGYRGS